MPVFSSSKITQLVCHSGGKGQGGEGDKNFAQKQNIWGLSCVFQQTSLSICKTLIFYLLLFRLQALRPEVNPDSVDSWQAQGLQSQRTTMKSGAQFV